VRPAAAAAVALATFCGCAASRPVLRHPVAEGDLLPSAETLLRALSERRDALQSLRTLARLEYSTGEETRRAKQFILAARPDRLRFEVLSPFGAVFVLTTSHGRLAAYARDEATVYRGSASPANLERYTTVELPIAAAVDLLLGTPPMGKTGQLVVSRDNGLIKLWQQASGGGARVTWFTPRLDPALYEEQAADGRVILRARFEHFADVSSVRLPTRLSLETPPAGRRVDIDLRDPEVNPTLADPLFALDTIGGTREIDLDQGVN
jgi:hypothetical protein